MTNSEIRVLEMLIRVRQFGASHASSFPAGSLAAVLLAKVAASITKMENQAATQQTHARAAKEMTAQKGAAFETLQEQMRAFARTSRTMEATVPGSRDRFRLPRGAGVQTWLAAARSFADEAELLKDEFIGCGMDAAFTDTFRASIAAVSTSVNVRAQKSAAQVGATAAVGDAAEEGRAAVRKLDAILRNLFHNDPAALAEWKSAGRIERATHHVRPVTQNGGTTQVKS